MAIMEEPITMWELSKYKIGIPVNLCVMDVNTYYSKGKIKIEDFPSRLIMQDYYKNSKERNFVHISLDKDNPQLFHNKLNISEEHFVKVQYFIK